MAFNPKYLKVWGDQTTSKVMPVIWIYYNADGDTVTAAGYIPQGYNVKANDKIFVLPKTGSGAFHTASVAGGVITLKADA